MPSLNNVAIRNKHLERRMRNRTIISSCEKVIIEEETATNEFEENVKEKKCEIKVYESKSKEKSEEKVNEDKLEEKVEEKVEKEKLVEREEAKVFEEKLVEKEEIVEKCEENKFEELVEKEEINEDEEIVILPLSKKEEMTIELKQKLLEKRLRNRTACFTFSAVKHIDNENNSSFEVIREEQIEIEEYSITPLKINVFSGFNKNEQVVFLDEIDVYSNLSTELDSKSEVLEKEADENNNEENHCDENKYTDVEKEMKKKLNQIADELNNEDSKSLESRTEENKNNELTVEENKNNELSVEENQNNELSAVEDKNNELSAEEAIEPEETNDVTPNQAQTIIQNDNATTLTDSEILKKKKEEEVLKERFAKWENEKKNLIY
ncbi:hypothetical protein GVAV_001313 [Gurleya vavrai]